jgi:hypothetical protein
MHRTPFGVLNWYSLILLLTIFGKTFSIHTLDWEIYVSISDADAVPNRVVHKPSLTAFDSLLVGVVFAT